MITFAGHAFALGLDLAWRGTWLVAAYLLLRAIVGGRVPARWLFVGWIVVALRLVVPAGVSTVWSPFNWVMSAPSVAPTMAHVETGQQPVLGERTGSVPPAVTAGTGPTFPWKAGLGLLWMAGAVAFALTRGVVARRQFDRWRSAGCPTADWVRALLVAESAAARLSRLPQIRTSRSVPVPAISGFLRPTLWLPAGCAEKLGEADLRNVIRHELGHWRRRDLWAQELFALVRVLHWWNPLVWLAASAARADCEVACDEFVMQRSASAEPAAYGASLLKVLGAAGGRTGTSAALGVFESRKQLKRRIQMIAKYRAPSTGRTMIGVALLVLVVAIAATRELRAGDASPTKGVTTTAPEGWWKNGNANDKYVVGVDSAVGDPVPPSAYARSIEATGNDFGGMMQTCDATNYRGKRVRLSAKLKTRDAVSGACLWLRVDGVGTKMLAFDNMQDRAVTGTRDWTPCTVVLDVPTEAVTLNYGFFLQDKGEAWVSGLAFDEVGSDVATTGRLAALPAKPTNLGFEPTLKQ